MLRFPVQKDVRLLKSPLNEVICQVRYPPVLRIAEEKPIGFQERLRGQFPELRVEHGIVVHVPSQEISPPSPESGPSIFRFLSRDGDTVVSLAAGFYALSTKAYTHWPDFLRSIQMVNEAACAEYALPYATRIGLRYINHLTLENTGTHNLAELYDILRPELTVLLRADCWDEPLEMLNQLLLTGEDGENLTLRTGLKREEDEPFFLLDFDCYVEGKTDLEQLARLCSHFHDVIYGAFRWCIREDRLNVFEPILANEET
jgi:uncharacterized protein (TIGR04255 family)